jgi:cytochrome c-type biogenesis protein CcmE
MKAKHQRLILGLVSLAALVAAGFIAASALRDKASYFYTPTTLARSHISTEQGIRLGGMVKRGSIERAKDGVSINFTVQDQYTSQRVFYRGITPDLFVEGSGVVADGKMRADGTFIADSLLAKHDENYVPRELKDIDMNRAEHTQDTLAKDIPVK